MFVPSLKHPYALSPKKAINILDKKHLCMNKSTLKQFQIFGNQGS
jgi:hypothetical protein